MMQVMWFKNPAVGGKKYVSSARVYSCRWSFCSVSLQSLIFHSIDEPKRGALITP